MSRAHHKKDPSMTGKEFKQIRVDLGLSQQKLADMLGISLKTVCRMEMEHPNKPILLFHAKHVRLLYNLIKGEGNGHQDDDRP